nr:hypothetical protein [Tanacetum cinerariifolium]
MPLSTYSNLGLGDLTHTRLTIELADRTVKHLRGIAENVLVRFGKFILPIDIVILDIPKDDDVPLILGRTFLSTAHGKIDVFKIKITLRDGEEKLVFKIKDKGDQEGKNLTETLIDIPIFVGNFSTISGVSITDDMDITSGVELGTILQKVCVMSKDYGEIRSQGYVHFIRRIEPLWVRRIEPVWTLSVSSKPSQAPIPKGARLSIKDSYPGQGCQIQ